MIAYLACMPQQSAGLLMYRRTSEGLEFFLIHPGGPFWAKKNEGAWSIPKGLANPGEDLLKAAQREFREETGLDSKPPYHSLGSVKLKSGKTVHAWAFEGSWEVANGITSNRIQLEWPPRSKKYISIPEADRAEWMTPAKAFAMISSGQLPILNLAILLLE